MSTEYDWEDENVLTEENAIKRTRHKTISLRLFRDSDPITYSCMMLDGDRQLTGIAESLGEMARGYCNYPKREIGINRSQLRFPQIIRLPQVMAHEILHFLAYLLLPFNSWPLHGLIHRTHKFTHGILL